MRENHTLLLRSATFSNFENPLHKHAFKSTVLPFPYGSLGWGCGGNRSLVTRMDSSASASPNSLSPSFSKLQKFPTRPSTFPLRLSWMGVWGKPFFDHKERFPPLPSPASVSRLSSSSSASPFCVFCACVVYCNRGGEKDANCTCYRRLPGNRRSHRA